jgi:hypothetical protein
MKTPQKRWPDNVEQFRIADLPVGALDQPMMRLMRKIADIKGWTVEEVMLALVVRCEAERKLEAKIIPFPKIRSKVTKSTRAKHWCGMRKPFMLPELREARKRLGVEAPNESASS